MNQFTIVFGTPDQFSLKACMSLTERFSADSVEQFPIFSRAHLAQAVGELEDQNVDGESTVLIVTDATLCLKDIVAYQRTFPELVGAYYVESLDVNIIPRGTVAQEIRELSRQ